MEAGYGGISFHVLFETLSPFLEHMCGKKKLFQVTV